MLYVFLSGASIFPFDTFSRLCRSKKNGDGIADDRGKYLQEGTQSRRVVDVNLLHPDEAKSKGGEIRSGDGVE